MSSITSINRVSLWSIQIHSNASTKLEPSRNDVKAGFVCCDGLGISTNTIFEDLKIIYPSLHYCPDEFKLALWQERDDGSAEFTSAADGNKEFRMATDSPKLILGLIFHNKSHPLCTVLTDSATITHHINAGCAVVPNLNFDPQENGHLPDTQNYFIPSARSSRPSTPSQKRKFAEDSTSGQSTPASLESPRKQDQDSRMFIESLGVDTRSFEKSVKGSYSKCVITNTDSKWGTLICGPGYVAVHIVPQKFWFSYPDWRPSPDYENYPFKVTPSYNTHENGLRQRMQSTWEPANGLLLRADIHDMFDRRMIAIHPITFQIRLFAPMSVAMEYHGKVIEWETIPDRAALAYHYSQCVIENVAAGLVSASKFVVPENWKQAINMISQLALNRRLQELRDQVGDGSADDATYYLEDGLTKGREEEIESWLERYNNT
ncbi:hypothetical protein AOL_s00110g136 [Orbilia oligospora ATCC 24927]|uniref:HNH nuclease domain-containing protein n=1 Tax=Arthrobotrys oligospora (strain ATCC 24927 / CBS 115.81 / DSM 1491) TaxID=756982 RepID=G1XKW6_ARTOA|nr:hypothetical protein AOL_s00110g136 [Orbilia oligospora ATCC 24927]EGX46312.1 hypothetical protein AOL_s00110g136 [Orbilia oligospora ATCC 24927]